MPERLSFQQGLDRFWTEATAPDTQLTQDLLRALAGCIQIRGVFFQEPGLRHGVERAVQRLLQRRVGLPLGRGQWSAVSGLGAVPLAECDAVQLDVAPRKHARRAISATHPRSRARLPSAPWSRPDSLGPSLSTG